MSYSETITKADLTNILNEVLPISYSLSSVKTVTLPFTPTSNGLLIGLIRANSQGRAYVTFNNVTPTFFDGYQAADGYFIGVGFAEKGKQISTTSAVSNVKQQLYYFVSLGNDALTDYIVDEGTYSGNDGKCWYRKWNSGILEVWYSLSVSLTSYSSYNIGALFKVTLNFYNELGVSFVDTFYTVSHTWQVASGVAYPSGHQKSTTSVEVFANANNTGTKTCDVTAYMCGRWK